MHGVAVEQVSAAESYSTHLVMLETKGTAMKEVFRRPSADSLSLLKGLTRVQQRHSLRTEQLWCSSR